MKITSCYFTVNLICIMPLIVVSQNSLTVVTGRNIAVVKTQYGAVRGYIYKGTYTFKGIPYGKADRFMAPQSPEKWTGIRNSMSYGFVCPPSSYPVFSDEFAFAFHRDLGVSDENCLNLNIWTQSINTNIKKPVMVYLHGGGFSSGSSHEFPWLDGENLSKQGDVVVVSFNHRLNILGFLDLSAYGDKYRYSANAGAMDMVLALTWVKENIANFGGDARNVTIFGQSGGGTKVMCLMNVPSAKGLFQKAIVQSGSSLTHIIEPRVSKKISAELLKELDLRPDDVDSLQKIPFVILDAAGKRALSKVEKTLKPEEMSVFGLEWEPMNDGDFLPYQPNEKAAIELSKDIPLLVGSCKNEFMPFITDSADTAMEEVKLKIKKRYAEQTMAYIAAVKKAYPNTVKPIDYINIDFLFRPLAIAHADEKSLTGNALVYMYIFNWQSPVLDGKFKAMHCMDLPFVFDNIQYAEEMTGGGKNAYATAEKVSEAWINFARTGNPNHKGLPRWPLYNSQNGATMLFDKECEVKYHHDQVLLSLTKDIN